MILYLEDKIERTPGCFSFCFKPQTRITWKAGQYMQFTLPHENPDDRGISRYFTISSAPHEEYIMITTRYAGDSSSTFKKSLMNLEKGNDISAFPPQGEFVVDDFNKNIVLIAGGIGITPFRSIVLDLEYKKKLPELEIYLLYSNRDSGIVFRDEFDRIAVSVNTFRIRYIVSPERLDIELIKMAVLNYREKIYYISGPPGLVKSVEEALLDDGIDSSEIKLDYFPGY